MREGYKVLITELEDQPLKDVEERYSDSFNDALLAMSFLFCSDSSEKGISSSIDSRAHMVVTTRGALGCLLMRRGSSKILESKNLESSRADYSIQEQVGNPDSQSNTLTGGLLKMAPLGIHQFLFYRTPPHGRIEEQEIFEVTRCVEPFNILMLLFLSTNVVYN